jgi:hypothetical protein
MNLGLVCFRIVDIEQWQEQVLISHNPLCPIKAKHVEYDVLLRYLLSALSDFLVL